MLFSSLMDNQWFRISASDPLEIYTLNCDCRKAWLKETQEWLGHYDLAWDMDDIIFHSVKFNDTNTLIMFKLAFAGTLSHKCRH